MIRSITLAIFATALAPLAAPAATCAGADPAITTVKMQNVTSSGSLNYYHMVGTVTNLGAAAQASNVLQFVDIYRDGQRLDDRGIPPLGPGKSYTFSFVWPRAVDAGQNSTTMRFSIRFRDPSPPGSADCDANNDTFSLTF